MTPRRAPAPARPGRRLRGQRRGHLQPAGVVRGALAGRQHPGDHPGTVLGVVVHLGHGLRRHRVQLGVGEAGPDHAGLGEQRHRVERTGLGVTGGGARHQVVEPGRESGDDGRGSRDALVEMLVDDLRGGVAGVRLGAREHLVQHDAAGVHIGAGVRGAVLDLLGGEIGDRAQDGAGGVRDRADRPDQAEVGDLDPAVVADQHVLRLHVPVDETRPVGGAQRGEDRLQDVQRGPRLKGAPLAQHVAQRAAGDVLHREVDVLLLRALVEDRDHVGVRQPGHRLGLADEALDERGVGRERRMHHLEGEHPVEPGVHGPVDRGHAAHGDAGIDAVAAVEQLPDERVLEGRIHAAESTSHRGHGRLAGAIPGPYCSRAVTGTCDPPSPTGAWPGPRSGRDRSMRSASRTGRAPGSERRALRIQHRTPRRR